MPRTPWCYVALMVCLKPPLHRSSCTHQTAYSDGQLGCRQGLPATDLISHGARPLVWMAVALISTPHFLAAARASIVGLMMALSIWFKPIMDCDEDWVRLRMAASANNGARGRSMTKSSPWAFSDRIGRPEPGIADRFMVVIAGS